MNLRNYLLAITFGAFIVGTAAPKAMAVTPEADPASGKFPVAATATSGPSRLSGSFGTVECTSGSGTGQATSSTTGEGSYTLHGCTSPLGTSCTSAGQPSGSIKLETVILHLVYLDENHTKPGILATPPASGVFATFACAFLGTMEVKGNGVLSEITAPQCGQTSTTATSVAEGSQTGVQKYRQVEETGTQYDMTASISGGTPSTVATTWTVTATSSEQVTLTCPEQK